MVTVAIVAVDSTMSVTWTMVETRTASMTVVAARIATMAETGVTTMVGMWTDVGVAFVHYHCNQYQRWCSEQPFVNVLA